jgi:hypothetical protein
MESASWSERTFARYYRAVVLLRECGINGRIAIAEATRPNGSVNVSKLERAADREIALAIDEGRL